MLSPPMAEITFICLCVFIKNALACPSMAPGLAILITALGYNLLGEGIRDALDPRLKE